MIYAQLGDIIFDLLTAPTDYTLGKSVNFAEFKTLEGKPKLQFTGANLDELSLKFALHSSFCDPRDEVKKLENLMLSGLSAPLIFTNGDYAGDFAITSISQSLVKTDKYGNPIYIQLDASLKEAPVNDEQREQNKKSAKIDPNSATLSKKSEDDLIEIVDEVKKIAVIAREAGI